MMSIQWREALYIISTLLKHFLVPNKQCVAAFSLVLCAFDVRNTFIHVTSLLLSVTILFLNIEFSLCDYLL